MVTNGSDEALTLLCRATLDAERSAAFPEVTYSLYKTLVTNAGASYTEVPVIPSDNQPYGVDVAALENSAAQVVFLANPNAITGEYSPREKLKATLAQSHKLWIIDEAYNDFAGHDATMLPFVPDLKNLVVTRTFSKTHALAGLRVGYLATSNHALLNGLMAHKDSYNEDALATRLAKVALNDTAWHQKTLDAVREGHAYLFNTLASMGFTPYTSSANFLLVKVPPPVSAEALAQKLRDYKLLIRYYPNSKFSDCVRISVGAMEENQKLIAAIGSIYAHAQ
ncbi:MAG TPA: histidinol-phosphate transaminase [Turneriella sp.]|nr:histidinol-phosphate transaminase [Turneriella sp.]